MERGNLTENWQQGEKRVEEREVERNLQLTKGPFPFPFPLSRLNSPVASSSSLCLHPLLLLLPLLTTSPSRALNMTSSFPKSSLFTKGENRKRERRKKKSFAFPFYPSRKGSTCFPPSSVCLFVCWSNWMNICLAAEASAASNSSSSLACLSDQTRWIFTIFEFCNIRCCCKMMLNLLWDWAQASGAVLWVF